jgi:hypothetical protein
MAKDYYAYEKAQEEENPKPKKRIFSKIDKWKVFKQIASMAMSGCATVVVSRYLKANMPQDTTVAEKVVTGIGMYCITGIVGTKVAEYADQELESWRESITIKDQEQLPEGETDGRE